MADDGATPDSGGGGSGAEVGAEVLDRDRELRGLRGMELGERDPGALPRRPARNVGRKLGAGSFVVADPVALERLGGTVPALLVGEGLRPRAELPFDLRRGVVRGP